MALINKQNIRNLSIKSLTQLLKEWGVENFRLKQVLLWLYQKDIASFEEMTNVSKAIRTKLEEEFVIERLPIVHQSISEDGTQKFLIQLNDGQTVESVLIPAPGRSTLCISSQVGCAMACRYCLTGLVGLKRNLTQFEIVEQVMAVKRAVGPTANLTNIVFMGMGEPMHNLAAVVPAVQIMIDERCLAMAKRKITVSTSGLVPQMLEFGSKVDVKLAISLCATTNEVRDLLVPINRKYPLEILMKACRDYPLSKKGKITMEYVMLSGINDSHEDAHRLTKLLARVPSKINLIPFNEFPGSEFKRPSEESLVAFQKILQAKGFQTNIRASRGRDILGACGQLKAAFEAKPRDAINWSLLLRGRSSSPP